ncbi:hypothetical protein [Bradyrhizobium sp. USDA 4520]
MASGTPIVFQAGSPAINPSSGTAIPRSAQGADLVQPLMRDVRQLLRYVLPQCLLDETVVVDGGTIKNDVDIGARIHEPLRERLVQTPRGG